MSSAFPRPYVNGALMASLMLSSVGGGLFLPLSLVFFVELTTIPLALLGAIIGAAGVVTLPVPLVAGRHADRFGARHFVIIAIALQSVAFLGFAVAREPLGVLAVSMVMSLGSRLYWSTIFAALADLAERSGEDSRGRWFAVANIIRTAGIAVGGLITGVALIAPDASRYVTLALVAAGCLAGSAALMLWTPSRVPSAQPERHILEPRSSAFRNRRFLALLTVNTVFAISTLLLGLALPTVVAQALRAPGGLTASLLVGNALLIAVLGVTGARWASRRSGLRVLGIAAALWAAGCGLLALASSSSSLAPAVAALAVAVVLFSLAEILHAPTSLMLVSDAGPGSERGTYLALFQYSFVFAEIIGPVLFAGLFAQSHGAPFLVVLALNVAAIPALAALARLR